MSPVPETLLVCVRDMMTTLSLMSRNSFGNAGKEQMITMKWSQTSMRKIAMLNTTRRVAIVKVRKNRLYNLFFVEFLVTSHEIVMWE